MKLDMVRQMGLDKDKENNLNKDNALSEQQTMEMRLDLLNQQEMQKLKNTAELLKTLQGLQKSIKEATSSVQTVAHEVRGYPVEVITQVTAQIELMVKNCEQAALKAQQVYSSAQETVSHFNKHTMYMVLAASVISPLLMAVVLLFAWRV